MREAVGWPGAVSLLEDEVIEGARSEVAIVLTGAWRVGR